MSEAIEILDNMLLTDRSQVDALSSPFRMRILQAAVEPVTVKALAERFGVPKTRLYYHVNLLVKEGLLVQVDEQMSGARVERIYRTAAHSFAPGPGLVESVEGAREVARLEAGLVLDSARREAETMLEGRLHGESTPGELARMMLRLTDDEAREFAGRLANLCAELSSRSGSTGDEETDSYAFSFVFAPTDLGAGP